jgi:hypothetical protein
MWEQQTDHDVPMLGPDLFPLGREQREPSFPSGCSGARQLHGTFATCATPLPATKKRVFPNFTNPIGAFIEDGALPEINLQRPGVPAMVVTSAVELILRKRQFA